MSSYTYLLHRPLFFVLVLHFFSSIAQATVPSSNTFTFLIDGIFDGLLEENQLYYTDLPFKTQPFALCVYRPESAFASNDTAFTLALRLDTRLVWQANRGKPVGKNSTVALRRDGNLVLANAKGNVVWQTNTANKGVVDIKLLANGNLVLLDKRGGFVWQSFDHPTDTILVGQSLFPGDENKLASRQGAYSLVLEGGRIVFNYKSKYSPQPQIYSLMGSLVLPLENTIIARMTLVSSPVNQEPYLFDLQFNFTYFTPDSSSSYSVVPPGLELKYNTTYSYLQLSQDGNLRIYTYFDKVHHTFMRSPWEETFTMFSRKPYYESECQLPEKCGEFGVCEDNQCVACPTAKGLMGWSRNCASPKLPPCSSSQTNNAVDYYKIVGVDHFSSSFFSGFGPVELAQCRDKCTEDCKCLGFFYRKDTWRCLLTPQLMTLTRVSNSTHLAFIKIAK